MDHDLDRFVAAQNGVYPQALAELRCGAKRSHWMWFVFPQIAGLGQSAMARTYAIADAGEARAYLRINGVWADHVLTALINPASDRLLQPEVLNH